MTTILKGLGYGGYTNRLHIIRAKRLFKLFYTVLTQSIPFSSFSIFISSKATLPIYASVGGCWAAMICFSVFCLKLPKRPTCTLCILLPPAPHHNQSVSTPFRSKKLIGTIFKAPTWSTCWILKYIQHNNKTCMCHGHVWEKALRHIKTENT